MKTNFFFFKKEGEEAYKWIALAHIKGNCKLFEIQLAPRKTLSILHNTKSKHILAQRDLIGSYFGIICC